MALYMQTWHLTEAGLGGNSWGTWEYEAIDSSELKEYKIDGEYEDTYFGTGYIVTPIAGTSGEDRFYIMALENVDTSYHYWYYNAYGYLPDEKIISYTVNDFGEGLTNTEYWLEAYENETYGDQYTSGSYTELWGMEEVGSYVGSSDSVWFVPSKSEWSAFRRCIWN